MLRSWIPVLGAAFVCFQTATSTAAIRLQVRSHVITPPRVQHCAAWPSGSGILSDGDFHGAVLPPNETYTEYSAGQIFAPSWRVKKRTIDVVAPGDFNPPNGVCSIDLDGKSVGAIEHRPISTTPSVLYTVSFLFSGNGSCGPEIKTMVVQAAGQSETLTWNLASQGNAHDGNFLQETWSFTATSLRTRLAFISKDASGPGCGPVVAAISVTQNQ